MKKWVRIDFSHLCKFETLLKSRFFLFVRKQFGTQIAKEGTTLNL